MIEATTCAASLPAELTQLYTILKSDDLRFIFEMLVALRTIIYFCSKSPYSEARDLAAIAIVSSVFMIVAATSGSKAPDLMRQIVACDATGPQSRIALTGNSPPACASPLTQAANVPKPGGPRGDGASSLPAQIAAGSPRWTNARLKCHTCALGFACRRQGGQRAGLPGGHEDISTRYCGYRPGKPQPYQSLLYRVLTRVRKRDLPGFARKKHQANVYRER